jgi:hypothetical protein
VAPAAIFQVLARVEGRKNQGVPGADNMGGNVLEVLISGSILQKQHSTAMSVIFGQLIY